jgi:hypothetical protein
VLKINEGIVGPQPLAEVFAGHELTGALEEHREQLERLLLKGET